MFYYKKAKKNVKKSKKKFHRFSKKFHRFFCSKKIPPVFDSTGFIWRKNTLVQWCIQTLLTKIECLLQCEITPGLVYDRDALESSFVDENVVKNISLHTGLKYTPWNSYENLFLKYARKYNRFYNPFPWLRKTYSGNLHPLLVYPYLIFSCLRGGSVREGGWWG